MGRKEEWIYGGGGGPVDKFTVEIRHPITRQKSKKCGTVDGPTKKNGDEFTPNNFSFTFDY